VNGFTPLFNACENGHAGVVEALLTRKEIDSNEATANGFTPLVAACQKDHIDVVRLLLASEEIDINKEVDGLTPLQFAQAEGYTEIVALLQHAHQEL
tara:strand:- start:30 stop:320 length:291 start_codon:yes stop_codon:yes gene_type:complete